MNPGPSHPFHNTWSRWFFTAAILGTLWLAYLLVQPYLVQIFLAIMLAVVSAPLYDYLVDTLEGRCSLASALTCLVLIMIIVVPFFLVAGLLTTQALSLYRTMSTLLFSDQWEQNVRQGLGWLAPHVEQLQNTLGISQADVLKEVGELVRKISNLLYANLTGLLAGVTNMLVGFALMMFVTFYLLIDGPSASHRLMALSPLPEDMNQKILQDIMVSLRATIKGTVVLALINGTVGGGGFWLFGVPNALFWGTVMTFASVVPIVGTALVWLPSAIYLAIIGHPWPAVGVAVWCLISMLICDNLLRPRLIGRGSNLHPLLTFFSVLGGLSYFGLVGLFLGPLLLAILLSLLDVYQRYFLPEPSPEPAVCKRPAPDPPAQPQAAPESNKED